MALRFGDFEDVVLERAPLTNVLCQVRFEPVLSLLSEAGVAGFQEALRSDYPRFDTEQTTEVQFGNEGTLGVKQAAPIWRLTSDDDTWRVSLAVDFIALERAAPYTHITDFTDHLRRVIEVLDRTVHPAASTRIGLRKINVLSHPDVAHPSDWVGLLRPDVLGLPSADLPVEPDVAYAIDRLKDGTAELDIRRGVLTEDPGEYVIDLDYWTEMPYDLSLTGGLFDLLRDFSDSMTNFFRWCLETPMYEFLGPTPRPTGQPR